jgi:aryl-alcohol dehydrogenase-like predicted oxidoreductase
MTKRIFGKTGWRCSEIGIGTWQFGGAITLDGQPDGWTGVTDEESIATVRRAVDLGVNFFDTSDQYGWGRSETILGAALKDSRNQVWIATKVGFGVDADGRRTFKENRAEIVAACEASLRRLQTDHIDLYQCHLWRTERWTEFLEAFDVLQRAGKIRFFGVSTNDLDMVQRFDERHTLSAVQCNYNLLDRRAETTLLPYCRARGIAVIARGVLAMGKLSGKYRPGATFDPDDIRTKWLAGAGRAEFDRQMELIAQLTAIGQRAGYSLTELAVKFVLSHVAVSVALTGVKNRAQAEANCAITYLPPLTRDELTVLQNTLNAATGRA